MRPACGPSSSSLPLAGRTPGPDVDSGVFSCCLPLPHHARALPSDLSFPPLLCNGAHGRLSCQSRPTHSPRTLAQATRPSRLLSPSSLRLWQVEILRMLRILGKGHAETSDQMNDILAQARGIAAESESPALSARAVEGEEEVDRTPACETRGVLWWSEKRAGNEGVVGLLGEACSPALLRNLR
eukprot:6177684-Pleurochrysis_carterae.AAC.8